MKKYSLIMVQWVLLVIFTCSNAGAFGVPKLVSNLGGNSQEGATIESAVASQGKLVGTYVDATRSNIAAQKMMADALGLKDKIAELEAQGASLGSGNVDKGEIEKTREVSKAAQEQIDERLAEAQELSPEAKKKVACSLIPLAQCVLGYKEAASLSSDSLELANDVIKNAPLTQKLSFKKDLDKVFYLAPKVPGDLTSVLSTAKKYVDFAKDNNVEIPNDATEALGDL